MKKVKDKIILVILLIIVILTSFVLYQKLILKEIVPRIFGIRNFNCKNW